MCYLAVIADAEPRSEPILTFRFWLLSTFWVVAGCTVSTIYYFKPYVNTLTSYAVQLLSWGMGDRLAKWLPNRKVTVLGRSFNLNPGPWNAKEHALIVVAYWGSVSPLCIVCTSKLPRPTDWWAK